MPNSKPDEVDIPHYRSRMVYLRVKPLADELGLSVYTTRVLMIIAVHTHENSPVSANKLAELWEMDKDDVKDAIGEFTLWNGYVSHTSRGKLIANFDRLKEHPLWSPYFTTLVVDDPIPFFLTYGYTLIGDAEYRLTIPR